MSLADTLSAERSQALQAIIKSRSETLIATDFDGTLAPIVDDPEKAYADPGDLAAFRAVRDLEAAGVTGLLVCSASNEEEALTEVSDVIVDGPMGLAAWLNALAERLERRA